VTGGHHLETDVAELAFEAARAEDQHAPDALLVVGDVERRRAGRRHDGVGRDRRAHRRQTGDVVGSIVHRVVGHVDHVVTAGGAVGQDGGHTGNGIRAAIDDAVEVDEQEESHVADRSRGRVDASARAGRREATGQSARTMTR
jgi:hypothetical protein